MSRGSKHTRNCDNCGDSYTGYGERFCSLICSGQSKSGALASGDGVLGITDEPVLHLPDLGDHHDPERRWAAAKKTTQQSIEYHEARHTGRLEFDSDKPVGISFISDQHVSESGAVDLERMEADAVLVRETPGLYALLGGDGIDGHIKHWSAVINNASRPEKELELFDHYLSFFGAKIAGIISGNHDDWIRDHTSVDVISQVAKANKLWYAPDFLQLDLALPGQSYRIIVRHQYRYESSFNLTHAIKRLWEMTEDFDVACLGHKHEAALEPFIKHGIVRVGVRPGSYQIVTAHSRRYGWRNAIPSCPTVIFYPKERHMVGFWDVRDAASYLKYLRS